MKDHPITIRTVILFCLMSLPSPLRAEDLPKAIPHTSGLHNVFKISTNLWSGSQPEGDTGFAALEKLGVTTILSVDGTIPDVENAHRHGMRYIHLPFGYDGIPTNRIAELAKVAATVEGSLYVHCHHGKHRGPAAAAALCLAQGAWTHSEALAWLQEAGTSTNYPGLYRSVREYQPPSPAALAAVSSDFAEISRPSGLVQSMTALDEHYERLKAFQQVGWRASGNRPDVTPAQESLMVWEQLREIERTSEPANPPAGFDKRLRQAMKTSDALRMQLQLNVTPHNSAQLDRLLHAIGQDCAACHRDYRN